MNIEREKERKAARLMMMSFEVLNEANNFQSLHSVLGRVVGEIDTWIALTEKEIDKRMEWV